ncbi:uncharacterized protein LOC129587815 [Paramacrobiotus metropolitanus]|uniref:uncharacterized protein LOC129587815 n=1 Tax=Paramacrobiotus metropolitanus TaxID=2943436 RepID=UPI0024461895|nr:uncharacterized protein LOC129587815 [Paramacrobiotus metropolitanus]
MSNASKAQYRLPTVKDGRRNVTLASRGTLDHRFDHIPFPLPSDGLCMKGLLVDRQVLLFDEAQCAFLRFKRGFFGNFVSGGAQQSHADNNNCVKKKPIQNDSEITYSSQTDPFPPPSQTSPVASLNLYEAYFLCYACGVLEVWDYRNQQKILRQHLMRIFTALDPLFPYFFAAYFHFRSKLYVIQSGLRFASDFVLYEYGPSKTHSLYAVYIVIPGLRDGGLSVLDTMQRAANAVKKDVLMVEVANGNRSADQLLQPDCFQYFQITEVIVRRRETILNPKGTAECRTDGHGLNTIAEKSVLENADTRSSDGKGMRNGNASLSRKPGLRGIRFRGKGRKRAHHF